MASGSSPRRASAASRAHSLFEAPRPAEEEPTAVAPAPAAPVPALARETPTPVPALARETPTPVPRRRVHAGGLTHLQVALSGRDIRKSSQKFHREHLNYLDSVVDSLWVGDEERISRDFLVRAILRAVLEHGLDIDFTGITLSDEDELVERMKTALQA